MAPTVVETTNWLADYILYIYSVSSELAIAAISPSVTMER